MKIVPETKQDLVKIIASEFPTFGGGKSNLYNPISMQLKDSEPQFALGVSVTEVVNRVLFLQNKFKIQ